MVAVDGNTMYFTDSFKKGIRKLDYFEDKQIPKNNQIFSDKYKDLQMEHVLMQMVIYGVHNLEMVQLDVLIQMVI